MLQIICDRNNIRKNFWRFGIFPWKWENSKSFVCWCRYAASARFSGNIKNSNVTINDTHHTGLKTFAYLFKIISKVAGKQPTNRHSEQQQDVAIEPDQVHAAIKHRYPKIQQQHQAPTTRLQTQKWKTWEISNGGAKWSANGSTKNKVNPEDL